MLQEDHRASVAHDAPGLIGLAMRGRLLTLGEDGCLKAIRNGTAALLLIDEGVSPGTLKKFQDAAVYHEVTMVMLKAGQLGRSIGRPGRRTAVVQDQKLAEGILRAIAKQENCAT